MEFIVYEANDFAFYVTFPAVDETTGKKYNLDAGTATVFFATTNTGAATAVVTGACAYKAGVRKWLCTFQAEQITDAAMSAAFAANGGYIIVTHESGVRVSAPFTYSRSRSATIA